MIHTDGTPTIANAYEPKLSPCARRVAELTQEVARLKRELERAR